MRRADEEFEVGRTPEIGDQVRDLGGFIGTRSVAVQAQHRIRKVSHPHDLGIPYTVPDRPVRPLHQLVQAVDQHTRVLDGPGIAAVDDFRVNHPHLLTAHHRGKLSRIADRTPGSNPRDLAAAIFRQTAAAYDRRCPGPRV
ncbi:hypothetical protein [Actinacidiphila paucisporea]|uniref:hypothetical protein n=1 Tax=Actinacidiphila paucisporea TaxID=310782 RepID=UPI0011610274|nr:hypothetical protein [Actinacidiphila paucisporea]